MCDVTMCGWGDLISLLQINIAMNRIELQQRTKQFNIDVIKSCEKLPRNAAGFEIAKQLIRAAGSVGANYRAKSKVDFIYKIQIVIEEADECHYWLEIIRDADLNRSSEIDRLIKEANELTAIFTSTNKTAKLNKQ